MKRQSHFHEIIFLSGISPSKLPMIAKRSPSFLTLSGAFSLRKCVRSTLNVCRVLSPLMNSMHHYRFLFMAVFIAAATATPINDRAQPLTSSTSATRINTTAPNCAPPGYPPDTPSTCRGLVAPKPPSLVQNLSTTATSPNLVTCLNDGLGLYIKSAYCASNMNDICTYLNSGVKIPRGQWIWSAGGPKCTFGVWLPKNAKTSAPDPKPARHCIHEIFKPMVDACGMWIGTANLKQLPRDDGFNGEAIDPNYPSYLMVGQTYYQYCGGFGQPTCLSSFVA